MRLSASDTT